jgi:hypothetical protein
VLRGFEAQSRTSAPPALSVAIRFAVSVVTCRHAAIVIPLRGLSFLKRVLMLSRTGMSFAAHSIRSMPFFASDISFTS